MEMEARIRMPFPFLFHGLPVLYGWQPLFAHVGVHSRVWNRGPWRGSSIVVSNDIISFTLSGRNLVLRVCPSNAFLGVRPLSGG